jgi:vitamin B12 transporter
MKKIFILFLITPLIISAQTDTLKTSLSEIIISANKTETPYYSIASSVDVITSEEIRKMQSISVVEILKRVPGISIIQQGGYGKLANVFSRGANPNHTLVLVDGIEMNDASSPNNAFDFGGLGIYDIDRIEIVRGPQSTLYGSDAMAGVINIFTKNELQNSKVSLRGEGGSYGLYQTILSASGKISLFDYFISFFKMGTDGFSASNDHYGNKEEDGFFNNGLTSNLSFKLSSSVNIRFGYRFSKNNSELDQNEKLGDDPNFTYKTEEHLFSGIVTINSLNGSWEKILKATLLNRNAKAFDDFDILHPRLYSDHISKSQRVKYEWQNNFRVINNNLITIGFEAESESANTSYFSQSEWGAYESIFPKETFNTTSFYFQDQINIANSFFTSIGLRRDSNNKFGAIVTYRIAPAYFLSETNTKFRATYGTGFKAPSLFNIFDPLFGNPGLKPEKSKGFDFGIDQSIFNGSFDVGLTYFNMKFENMFGYDSNFRTINIAAASSHGIEFYFTANPINSISISGNYTLTNTRDDYKHSSDYGRELPRRPKHQGNFSISYNNDNLINLNASIRFVSTRFDKDFSLFPVERVSLPGYYLVQVSGAYKIFPQLEIFARVENLLNRDYEEVLYYGTAKRSFYLGVSFDI